LLGPAEFRELVSGQRRGVGAGLARAGLRLLETPYALAMRLRNWRYDRGSAEVIRVDVPVVSIGNLTLGGTGKSPAVEWLARWYINRGIRVGLVSRGYGSVDGKPNDEALELAEKLARRAARARPRPGARARKVIDEFGGSTSHSG